MSRLMMAFVEWEKKEKDDTENNNHYKYTSREHQHKIIIDLTPRSQEKR